MKIAGALLFIMTTSWIGFDLSANLQNRTKQIREIIHSLQILEAEMGYSQFPLQVIFSTIHHKTSPPISTFYQFLSEKLTRIVVDFQRIWDEAILQLRKNSSLQDDELEILQNFGKNIGHYTFHQQQKHITLTIHHLQTILEEANDHRLKYEKMLKTLGVLIGLFIVLLLF